MKKKILLFLLIGSCALPLSSFKPEVLKVSTASKFKRITSYVGNNANPSVTLNQYYDVYTDGTTSIVQVTNIVTSTTYTAVGHTYNQTLPGGTVPVLHLSFSVYSGGIIIDSYNGPASF